MGGAAALALVVAGCASPPSQQRDADAAVAPADAPVGQPDGHGFTCPFPVDQSTPGGTVEIGTGTTEFEPMPDSIPFIIGGQGGVFLRLDAHITGLEPGDPRDLLNSSNPYTEVTATLADGTIVKSPCPYRVGYRSYQGGGYQLGAIYELPFLPLAKYEKAFNTHIKLKVEIVDSKGHYASDEKTVFATAPPSFGDGGIAGDGGAQLDAGASASDGAP